MIRVMAAITGFLMAMPLPAAAWTMAAPPDQAARHVYRAATETGEADTVALSVNERVVAARLAYDRATESMGEDRIAALEEALEHLRAVIRDHPSSDHAVTLVGGGEVAGISIPGVETELETARARLEPDTETAGQEEKETTAAAVSALEPVKVELTVRLPSSAELAEGAPRLGVEFSNGAQAVRSALGTNINGALVIDVIAESAAKRAGIQAGDFIVSLAERALSEPADLVRIVGDLPSGIAAPLELIRVGEGIDDLRSMLVGSVETGVEADRGTAFAALGDLARIGALGDNLMDEARRYYRAAMDAGDGYATYQLALLVDAGNGGEEDDQEALRLYRLAIERGQVRAAYSLGLLFWTGSVAAEDTVEAVRLFRMAAGDGITESYLYLGLAHHYGLGTEVDAEAARDWYEKSAATGHTEADYRLGVLYRDGGLGAPDLAEARRLFGRAAEAGIVDAQRELGVMFRDGQGGPVDDERAAALFRQAADGGDGAAMYYLGAMYLNGRVGSADPETAIAWLTKAVDTSIWQAHYWLALAHADLPASSQRAGTIADHLIAAMKAGDTAAIESLTERARAWSAAVRRAVQERLRDLGHYSGAIDGSFGPGTRRAIEALAGTG